MLHARKKENRSRVMWWIRETWWGWKRVHDPRVTIKVTFLFMYCWYFAPKSKKIYVHENFIELLTYFRKTHFILYNSNKTLLFNSQVFKMKKKKKVKFIINIMINTCDVKCNLTFFYFGDWIAFIWFCCVKITLRLFVNERKKYPIPSSKNTYCFGIKKERVLTTAIVECRK